MRSPSEGNSLLLFICHARASLACITVPFLRFASLSLVSLFLLLPVFLLLPLRLFRAGVL
jgi:hypothetical protein